MHFDKRLIFCLSPGRCGTQYLAMMLDTIPGVHAEHEGLPDFVEAARAARKDIEAGKRFWEEQKLPYIASLDCQVYAETGHLFGKGFAEPLLDMGIVPDVVVIRRPYRDVALSLWRRDSVPGRTSRGQLYLLHPEAPSLLPLPGWHNFTSYQLCYWYCLEMDRRIDVMADEIDRRGGRVAEVVFKDLVEGDGFEKIVKELGLPKPAPDLYAERKGQVYNPNPDVVSAGEPDGLNLGEKQVRDAIKAGAKQPKDGRPSVDIVVLHMGQVKTELAIMLLGLMTDRRYKIALSFSSTSPTSNNRNKIVKEFIFNERYADWLCMVDDDTVPSGDWLKYLNSDMDVVGFATPVWKSATDPKYPIVWNVQLDGNEEKFANRLPDQPMIEAASVGSGVILIRRKVLEHPAMKWPFKDIFDEDGIKRVGHDLSFCHRAREAGFKVMVSLAEPANHFKSINLREVTSLLWRYENAMDD